MAAACTWWEHPAGLTRALSESGKHGCLLTGSPGAPSWAETLTLSSGSFRRFLAQGTQLPTQRKHCAVLTLFSCVQVLNSSSVIVRAQAGVVCSRQGLATALEGAGRAPPHPPVPAFGLAPSCPSIPKATGAAWRGGGKQLLPLQPGRMDAISEAVSLGHHRQEGALSDSQLGRRSTASRQNTGQVAMSSLPWREIVPCQAESLSAAFNHVATSLGKLLPPPPAPLRKRLLRTPACPPPQLRPGTVRLRCRRPGPAYPSPFSLHKWQFGWELSPLIPFTNPDSCSVLTLTPGQWQGERGTAPKAVSMR